MGMNETRCADFLPTTSTRSRPFPPIEPARTQRRRQRAWCILERRRTNPQRWTSCLIIAHLVISYPRRLQRHKKCPPSPFFLWHVLLLYTKARRKAKGYLPLRCQRSHRDAISVPQADVSEKTGRVPIIRTRLPETRRELSS